MRRHLSPEARLKMQRLSYVMGAFVLLLGAYNGATAVSPSPSWLIAANVAFGIVNLAAARFVDRLNFQIEAIFEAITGLLIFGTSYATFTTGPRHYPLASAWAIAGCIYIGVAVLHWVKKGRIRGAEPSS